MLEESDWGLLPSTPAVGSSLGLLGDWREHAQSCAIERERISRVWDPAESWGVLSSLALRPALPGSYQQQKHQGQERTSPRQQGRAVRWGAEKLALRQEELFARNQCQIGANKGLQNKMLISTY